MSATTRSRALELAALLIVACMAHAATPPALPPAAAALVPGVRAIGGGELSWLGLAIYEGFYWAPGPGFAPRAPYALDLHYRRDLDGARIAQRSVDEIEKLGFGDAVERRRWGEAMRRLFPDVKSGDRLTGVNVPGRGAEFFHNGMPIGRIDDVAFAHAFFSIWLDPRTSRPDFRKRLLSER
jgi:hypothetical protein